MPHFFSFHHTLRHAKLAEDFHWFVDCATQLPPSLTTFQKTSLLLRSTRVYEQSLGAARTAKVVPRGDLLHSSSTSTCFSSTFRSGHSGTSPDIRYAADRAASALFFTPTPEATATDRKPVNKYETWQQAKRAGRG